MSNESTVFEKLFSATTSVHPTTKRQYAVACALELIKADIGPGTSTNRLDAHLNQLSNYADKIEAALKVKSE